MMRVTTLFGDLSLGRITDRRREIVLASVRGTWVQGSRRMAKYLYGKVFVRQSVYEKCELSGGRGEKLVGG